jgi:hypothetical protein
LANNVEPQTLFGYLAFFYAVTAKKGEDLTMTVEFVVDGVGNLAMRL